MGDYSGLQPQCGNAHFLIKFRHRFVQIETSDNAGNASATQAARDLSSVIAEG